VNRMIGVKS